MPSDEENSGLKTEIWAPQYIDYQNRAAAASPQKSAVVAGPFIYHHAKIIQDLNGGFDVATDRDALRSGSRRRLLNGYDPAVRPDVGRKRGYGLGQILNAHVDFLLAGFGWPQGAARTEGLRVLITVDDGQRYRLRMDHEEGVGIGVPGSDAEIAIL
jgi:hypothetical protein